MATYRNKVTFWLQIVCSSVLYLATVGWNAAFLYFINQERDQKLWFLPSLGILLISSVILQLVSAVVLLLDKGDKLSTTSSAWIAVLHIFQLGFLWRHVVLIREVEPNSTSREYHRLQYLRLIHVFTTLLPLSFIQIFLILHTELTHFIVIATVVVNILVSSWFLACFQHGNSKHAKEVQSCESISTVIKFLWRLGEISSRLVSLTVFATIYYFWIFLIIGLHGLTMLVCLCTSILGTFKTSELSRTSKVLCGLIMAYMYSFCFVNFSAESARFRHTLYYVIMSLENTALAVVWYLHSDSGQTELHKVSIIIFIACAFCIGILFLLVSMKFFEIKSSIDPERQHIYASEGCINCKLSVCSKHCIKLQRPFSAGYLSQYQKALASGQYFKNIMQDKYIDTEGESAAELLNSSGEHWQIRDTDVESIKTNGTKQYTSVQASGTYTHKRFFDSNSSIGKGNDTDSISSETGSGLYDEDWRKKSEITMLSAMDALSLVSSRTQLLTDSWDNLICQNNNVTDDHKHAMKIDVLNSLIRKDLESSFYSEDYTTDHTLDSYQLPVTVLAKKRLTEKRRFEPAYSTASDSTDCTICAFMRQHPSSPEESRRNFKIYDDIPEETQSEPTQRKRNEYRYTNSASKPKKSKPYRTNDSDDIGRHRYEKSSSRQRRRDLIRVLDSKSSAKDNERQRSKPPSTRITNTNSNRHAEITFKNPEYECQSEGQQRHDNEPSGSFTDSDDSAFPRNTPVCDRNSLKTDNEKFNDVLYSKPYKSVSAINSAKIEETCNIFASDSGDSTNSLKTPLRDYLVVLDNNKDGTSESSCEMII